GLKQHWHAAIHSQSLSQPLYIRNVATANGTHAEVYQTSLAGSIFAFNAQTGALDWSVALPNYTPSCAGGPIGVNDTPTIDTIKKLLYVV
ncbi:hypothetical protein ABI077_15310, partial [Enterococcus faecium]|uniref:hypothetical protein n=1 Tax=Enterococcus faecium TaxID=1352 RepID=UPI003F422B94